MADPTTKLPDTLTLDSRIGCVAIYEGPQRDCLAVSQVHQAFVMYRHGKYIDGEGWRMKERDVALAERVAHRFNTHAAMLKALEHLLACTHTEPGDCKSETHWESMMEHAQDQAAAAIATSEGK